jgi:carbonic anhydrase
MGIKNILRMAAGFKLFRDKHFVGELKTFDHLAQGQAPKTLVIGCSDSRVDPALIFSAAPGEIFVVRNVANLVPPFDSSDGYHGVSAAIEFAIASLKVENVIILGHQYCGGIRALVSFEGLSDSKYIGRWMEIAKPAKTRSLAKLPDADLDSVCRDCEMESIVGSLQNLKTFPFVQEAIKSRGLQLLGLYFDIEQGRLFEFKEDKQSFEIVKI